MEPTVKRVSASRVPALWDEHRFYSRRMLWEYCSRGVRPESNEPNPRARSGRMLEGAILAMAAEDLGCEVVHLPQDRAENYLQHPTLPTGCMPDGLVLHPTRGPGVISVKNVSSKVYARLWKPMKWGVPRDVEMQLQTELMVWRAQEDGDLPKPEWGCIAALEGGADLHLFERRVEEAWHGTLAEMLTAFFRSIVENNPPPWTYIGEELPVIRELWPYSEPGKVQDFDGDFTQSSNAATVIEAFVDQTQKRRELDKSIEALKVELLEIAGDAEVILTPTYRCKVARAEVPASHKDCPNCGHAIETRAASERLQFYPKEM